MNDRLKYTIEQTATVRDALVKLNTLSSDILTLFVMSGPVLAGTLTDGDIRRKLVEGVALSDGLESVMNRHFVSIAPGERDVEKIRRIRRQGIELLPCIDAKGHLLSIHNLQQTRSLLPIDAVLMAGGKGERLRPLTESTPKPLLEIGGKAIIDYNIDHLASFGVGRVHVTTNYLAEQMEAHFATPRPDIEVSCVREREFLGTIAAVKLIPDLEHDEVLVMNSDLFTNIDMEDFYSHFIRHGADMSVASIPYSVKVPFGIFELDGRLVKGVREKPTYSYDINAGIYLFKRELLDLIPDGEFFDATDLIELLAGSGRKVIRYPMAGYWIDIGSREDFKRAEELSRHI